MKARRQPHRVNRSPLPRPLVRALIVGAAAMSCGVARSQAPGTQQPEQRPQGQPATSGAQPNALPFVRGTLDSRYWLRWTGSEHDNDLYETLTLDMGDPDKHAVTGHFYGRLALDLDGDTNGSSPLFSLQDTLNDGLDAQIYDAYADVHRIDGIELLRAGRQTIFETPVMAFFDGIHCRTIASTTADLQFGAYGGISTHLYEASPDGDWTAGFYGECRPWDGGRFRFDWMHLEDEALLGPHANDLLGASIWHRIEMLQLEAQYTRLEGRDRDLRARASWSAPESRFTSQLTWYQLLTTQKSQVLELDPFFESLHELFPYWQLGGTVGKGLTDHVDVDLGADLRRVSDESDVGTFNRDYDRWYLSIVVHDMFTEGLTLTATADWWNSGDQDVQTWAGEISQRCGDLLTLSAGSYYSLYKFTLFANDERDHVRTYYARLKYDASHATEFDFGYEFEQTDLDDFQVLRMGFTWHF
jgi:hypothetical protein